MKHLVGYMVIAGMLLGVQSQAQAALVSGQDIINAPVSVVLGGATNVHQQAFNERQGVLLTSPLDVDVGIITAGTVVDSHMIFYATTSNNETADFNVKWTFDGTILGVMSDRWGQLEADSSGILGAPGTTYPAEFLKRGLDPNPPGDDYSVSANAITVDMIVGTHGDWIRVVTRHAETLPSVSGWGVVILPLLLVVGLTIHIARRRTVRA